MDSILSTVLSVFSHNPIIVLGIIAYVAFSIIRGKNNEESDEYESYESFKFRNDLGGYGTRIRHLHRT